MSLMPTPWEALLEGVLEGKPLTRPEAVRLYQEADLWSLGKAPT
jgi:hypothetical protein